MTSVYGADGRNVACTVIQAGPCVVTQVRTQAKDGYEAVQLGYGERKEKHTTKPMMGHFKKAGVTPKRKIVEFRNFSEVLGRTVAAGEEIKLADVVAEGDKVHVVGTSKGKGFQGVVKRHGFGGVGQATHGQHNRLRAPGSIGASSFPSRVLKGMRMGGRMGNQRVKVKNLKVLRVLSEENILLVTGAIPGAINSFVIIER